jgi:pimeloyl-ACP methyl ester carboxylesterase
MNTVQSKDGTIIAYDRFGQGPALILVNGAIANRADAESVARQLSAHFTVYTYDRRGRGKSGDTRPYVVEREIEDLAALVDEAGGSAFVFGHSSGAVLSMEAAARNKGIKKLAIYEPPFLIDDSRPPVPDDISRQLSSQLSDGRRSDMLVTWMTKVVGIPDEFVTQMRQQPSWPDMEANVDTVIYDLAVMGENLKGKPLSPELVRRLSSIQIPTLVMAGGASPDWMRHGAQAAAQAISGAQYRVLDRQAHGVADNVLTPALVEFYLPENG